MEVTYGNTFPQDGLEPAQNRKPQGRLDAEEISCKTQGCSEAMVAARDTTERCARSETRRVHLARSETNRSFAETLCGAQFAPQGRRLSLGALDADLLRQSCRQDAAEDPARQGRIEAAVWERVTCSLCPGRSAARSPCGAVRCRSGVPVCLRLEETGVPVLRSNASQELRGARDTRSVIQISNSHTSAFSRRRASEVCQSLAIPARGDGAAGGARGTSGHPLRHDLRTH